MPIAINGKNPTERQEQRTQAILKSMADVAGADTLLSILNALSLKISNGTDDPGDNTVVALLKQNQTALTAIQNNTGRIP